MADRSRQRLARLRELRVDYAQWHRVGMDALGKRDLAALTEAIQAETAIIEEQRRLIGELLGKRRRSTRH